LTFTAFGGGLSTIVTFGDGTGGTVKSLNELNAQLAGDNLTGVDRLRRTFVDFDDQRLRVVLVATVAGTAQAGSGTGFDTNGAFQASKGATTVATPIKDAASQAYASEPRRPVQPDHRPESRPRRRIRPSTGLAF